MDRSVKNDLQVRTSSISVMANLVFVIHVIETHT